jgi:tRNA pseudouridine55 synthase
MARKGDEVELKAKTLVVNEIEVLEMEGQRLVIRVVCGKGTYIRALARDIGVALGSGAHLTGLRRTQVGEVRVEKCMSVDEAVELINTVELETEEN